jgi:hypothetical protein
LKTKALFRLKKLMTPALPILGELQQELLFMTPMSNGPYLPKYVMPVGSCHALFACFWR